MNLNKVILAGNLTRDPELRNTSNGMAVCQIGLAVNRRWTDRQSNQPREETTFIDCEAFGRVAETIHSYMCKGRPIFIEGRLKLDQWEDQQGNKRSKLKVIVENFQFVGSRDEPQKEQRKPYTEQAANYTEQGSDDDIPF